MTQFRFNDDFSSAGLSDPGLARTENEDRFSVDSAARLLLVADGVGGHNSGEIASSKAVAALREHLSGAEDDDDTATEDETITLVDKPYPSMFDLSGHDSRSRDSTTQEEARIAAAVKQANRVVHDINRQQDLAPELAMGTTILGLQFRLGRPLEATIFHVGDSRLYLLRDDRLAQITRDHSAYEKWLADGETGPTPPKNIILQAIGPTAEVVPSMRTGRFLPGDLILMCSDGLNDMVDNDEIHDLLSSIERENLTAGCQRLIDASNSNGGTDNTTVVLGAFANRSS